MESDESVYADAGMLRISFGTGWTELEILSEVKVLETVRGYSPGIVVGRDGFEEFMFLGAASLCRPLEVLRKANGGRLSGLKVRVRKVAEHKTAGYECESLEG